MASLAPDIETQIDDALTAARPFASDEQAKSIAYDSLGDTYALLLRSGKTIQIRRADLQHVAAADLQQAANVQLDMLDSAVWWSGLDVAFPVSDLARGILGDAAWMRSIEQRGKLSIAA